MIVSGIWWRRAEAGLRSLKVLSLLSLLALGGCGFEQLLFGGPPQPPAPEPLPPSRGNAASALDLGAGLAPLPSPQQVVTAVPFGRTDPFQALPAPAPPATPGSQGTGTAAKPQAPAAPVGGTAPRQAAAGGGSSATPSGSTPAAAGPAGRAAVAVAPAVGPALPPEGFQLNGVIRSGGRAEALVTFGGASGSLRPGDRGGRTTGLLPAGWALASIQFGGRTPAEPPSITLVRAGRPVKVRL